MATRLFLLTMDNCLQTPTIMNTITFKNSRFTVKTHGILVMVYRVDHMFGNAVFCGIVSQLIDGGNFF